VAGTFGRDLEHRVRGKRRVDLDGSFGECAELCGVCCQLLSRFTRLQLGLMHPQHCTNALAQPFGGQRVLWQIVRGTGFHQLDRRLLVSETSQHDHRHCYPFGAEPAQQLESVRSGHSKIAKGTVEMGFMKTRERVTCVRRLGYVRVDSRRSQ